MTFSALLIKCRAFRQEQEQQHYSLPASAGLCNIPLPDVDYVPSSLPTLLGVMESRLTTLSLLGVICQHDQQTQNKPAQTSYS